MASGIDFPRIPDSETAVRFIKALPAICEAAKTTAEIAEAIVRGKDYETAYPYPDRAWQLRGFLASARDPAGQPILTKLNAAVRYAPVSQDMMAAIAEATRDARILPAFKERLSALLKAKDLPNLANGVLPEKNTSGFYWTFPGFKPERRYFVSFTITNRRVGKQGYWIHFAGRDTKSGRYRGGDELMFALAPGESRSIVFFGKTIKRTAGARLAVVAHPDVLEKVDDLEVSDLRICETSEAGDQKSACPRIGGCRQCRVL